MFVNSEILKGIGFFLNSSDTKELANNSNSFSMSILRASKVKWSALWIESPDGRKISKKDLELAIKALLKKNIKPVLWTFPSIENLKQSNNWIEECCNILATQTNNQETLIILDIEAPFKGKEKNAKQFVEYLQKLKTSNPNIIFGFTSYPFGHTTLPWDAFKPLLEPNKSPVMPQLYNSGIDSKNISKAFKHYANKYPNCKIVPIVASYIENSERLKTSLELIVPIHKPTAVGVWVLKTTDMQEANILSEYATKFI